MSKFHVTCTLENASESINGVAFVKIDGGVMTKDPVEAAVANMFVDIPGYDILEIDEEEEAAMAEARRLEAEARQRATNKAKATLRAAQAAKPAPVAPVAPAGPVAPEPVEAPVPPVSDAEAAAAGKPDEAPTTGEGDKADPALF